MPDEINFLDKKHQADKVIKRYTIYSAGAGFVPIPLLDAIVMSGVQFEMIRRLASLYEVPFKAQRAKAAGAAFMGSVGTISGFKFIPHIGTVLGGLSSSTIGAASTYAIGQVFTQHFDQGGTLLDFDPIVSRLHFEQELEKGKDVVAQLKKEGQLTTKKKGRQQLIKELVADSDRYMVILKDLETEIKDYMNQQVSIESES